ncbi:hypothetical protein Hypma_001083 [Hypsizygus marmoreus]|uniref:F-box domain-containing protein n=1 Tax=Hypsizygus marmoreus TaxID=39966 RepID=A0A369JDY5_HYPMA|nr:hypothetical protein Hypma_001083 [Hypsizygus marmoreus]
MPQDVLQHIAFLVATDSVTELPRHLSSLLLTNTQVYHSLSVPNCPSLYASIFRATFDREGKLHQSLTDSALAAELLRRYRFLWRIRRHNASSSPTPEDLLAALRMVLENNGRNDAHLAAANFPDFMLSFVRECLAHQAEDLYQRSARCTITSLALWLLCLTITHKDIVSIPEAMRAELRKSLCFPIIYPTSAINFVPSSSCDVSSGIGELEPSSPAIILAFALNEVVPLLIPPHIPQTRAIAIESQRDGPTVEDFQACSNLKTPLFTETRRIAVSSSASDSILKALNEIELSRVLYSSYGLSAPSRRGHGGSLAGLWEGNFMLSSLTCEPKPTEQLPPAVLMNFNCLKPMQCAISEYLCFSPHLPLPEDHPLDLLAPAIRSGKLGYQRVSPGGSTSTQRNPLEALDVVILGEDHEQAWNGFRFAGRMRSDGVIVMRREPKDTDDREGLGSWVFEGRLRYGAAFVGKIRSGGTTVRGIFSLQKTDPTWQR